MIEFSDAQIDHIESLFDEMGEEAVSTDLFVECERCLIKYPADDDYWYFLEGELQQPCKECTRKAAEEKHQMQLIAAAKTATAVLSEATINKIVQGKIVQVSGMEHLTDSVLQIFAGEAGIAKLLYNEYHSEKPNTNRVRILELIARMVSKADEIVAAKEKTNESVTDDDIRAILERLVPKLETSSS
jgi:hypothetical protein